MIYPNPVTTEIIIELFHTLTIFVSASDMTVIDEIDIDNIDAAEFIFLGT